MRATRCYRIVLPKPFHPSLAYLEGKKVWDRGSMHADLRDDGGSELTLTSTMTEAQILDAIPAASEIEVLRVYQNEDLKSEVPFKIYVTQGEFEHWFLYEAEGHENGVPPDHRKALEKVGAIDISLTTVMDVHLGVPMTKEAVVATIPAGTRISAVRHHLGEIVGPFKGYLRTKADVKAAQAAYNDFFGESTDQ